GRLDLLFQWRLEPQGDDCLRHRLDVLRRLGLDAGPEPTVRLCLAARRPAWRSAALWSDARPGAGTEARRCHQLKLHSDDEAGACAPALSFWRSRKSTFHCSTPMYSLSRLASTR